MRRMHKRKVREQKGTQVTIFRNRENAYLGFACTGHAGYDVYGRDIVCAGISALVLTTIESLDRLTGDACRYDMDAESGDIEFRFAEPAGHDAALLMQSMILGMEGIQASYGKEFLDLAYEEV